MAYYKDLTYAISSTHSILYNVKGDTCVVLFLLRIHQIVGRDYWWRIYGSKWSSSEKQDACWRDSYYGARSTMWMRVIYNTSYAGSAFTSAHWCTYG